MLNARQVKAILVCLLVFLGLYVFYFSVYGFATTPFFDVKAGIQRCPDWRFHECYASSLSLASCSNGAYSAYAPLVHLSSALLTWLSGLPCLFWLSLFNSASLVLLASLLWRHAGSVKRAGLAVSLFFLVLPLGFLVFFNNAAFTWIDLVLCGLVPFVVASALFCFFLLEARGLPVKWSVLVLIALVLTHNYGFLLAFFALCCLAVECFSGGRVKALWLALLGFFVWVVFLSSFYFTFASERVAFLLYFLLCLEFSRLVWR